MIKYQKIHEKKISLFKNILINGDVINAYYVLFPFNYDLMDMASADRHIGRLYSAISNLFNTLGEIKISIFQMKNIVSKEETIKSIINTVKLYKKDYNEFPSEYQGYIKNITKDFSILSIQLNVKNIIDIENQSLKSIIKQSIDTFVRENFTTGNVNIDKDQVLTQNNRIKNILARYAVPANEKLVMNIYINSLFPSYNLIYNDYIMKHADTILANIKQEIIPYLGYFEMTNSGIVSFGATPRKTYGSVLTILEFPESIYSDSFNIAMPGMKVNLNLLPKDKATLKFKRMRADLGEEIEEAGIADSLNDTDVEIDKISVQNALDSIRDGRIMTEADVHILVTADTLEELDKKKKKIISILSDIDVVCSINGNQAKTFINSFVKNNPSDYWHIMDLQYALSFQIDNGALVGDMDSKFEAPVIGVTTK